VPDKLSPLQTIIHDRIRTEGRITFADYMAACLYEPGMGYYTSPGRKVGAEGDFYTSSNVHALFGRLMAREIVRMDELLGSPQRFDLVEAGAGNGRLARDILDYLSAESPALYERTACRLLETEPTLQQIQEEMLGHHASRTSWSSPEELSSGRFSLTGCLYSNELIDSFPVHLVEMTPQGLQEVYVTLGEDDLREELGEPSTPELAAYLKRVNITLVEGKRAEINLAAPRWLASVASSLQRGFVLTVDYGYEAMDLFSPARLGGTLLCYHRHQVEESPYLRPGEQDITSHVDFTTLMKYGEEVGVTTVWFGEQYRFLMAVGFMEEMLRLESSDVPPEEKLKARLLMKKLILPEGGMGDTFRVLVQAKGVEKPRLRCMSDWTKTGAWGVGTGDR
jgi:SAM-dependent MidA family methyltransferase